MRTDGVTIVPEAIQAIRGEVEKSYGKRYVAPFIREYKTKAKNAQEAHEAIRPTDVARKPADVARYLAKDQAGSLRPRLEARGGEPDGVRRSSSRRRPTSRSRAATARPTGCAPRARSMQFDGFLKVYEEGRDERLHAAKGKDDTAAEDRTTSSRRLPALAQGDRVSDRSIETEQHFTQPPPRYSEATLVKRLEELGIGRPSTYASTLAVLQERDYVRIEKKRLIPEDKGRLVIAFLEGFFKRYVEYDFTADLEDKLDLISDGKLAWKDVLRDFWREFTGAVDEIKDLRVGEVLEALNEILGPHIFPPREDGLDPRTCPSCKTGRLSLKISGKYGAFIGCGNYPECRYTRQLADQSGGDAEASTPDGKQLGADPDTGLAVTLRTGRFGPYLQLGEASGDEKPKRASVPKGVDAASRRPRARAQAAVAAARGRTAPRDRQADHGRASGATDRSCCTTGSTPTSRASRTCSPSASTAPSRCSPKRLPAGAKAASSAPSRRS